MKFTDFFQYFLHMSVRVKNITFIPTDSSYMTECIQIMYKKSHVWSIAHDTIVGARQTDNPRLRFNATKRKKPNIFNPIYKYTNPANPVINFCMQKLVAPPW